MPWKASKGAGGVGGGDGRTLPDRAAQSTQGMKGDPGGPRRPWAAGDEGSMRHAPGAAGPRWGTACGMLGGPAGGGGLAFWGAIRRSRSSRLRPGEERTGGPRVIWTGVRESTQEAQGRAVREQGRAHRGPKASRTGASQGVTPIGYGTAKWPGVA